MANRRISSAQSSLPAIDEEAARRRRSSLAQSRRDSVMAGGSRASVSSNNPRPEDCNRTGGSRASVSSNNPRPEDYNRTNSAPDPGESPAEVPSDRSRMRVVRRRSTSSGLFSGLLPGMRSRTASIVSTQQGSQRNLMRGSEIHLEEEENFPFKEVKRKPLEHDVELEEMIIKRRESQRIMNFLHRQDSTPLLMNVERKGRERRVREQPPPYQFPILETPFSRCFRDGSLKRGPSEEESETSSRKRRYRGLFRFHPFKGRCGLKGLTKGVGEINSRNEKVDKKFPF